MITTSATRRIALAALAAPVLAAGHPIVINRIGSAPLHFVDALCTDVSANSAH